jgi:hypothetical protein
MVRALQAQIDELQDEMATASAEAERALARERQRADRLNKQVETLSAEVVQAKKQAETVVGRAERSEADRAAEGWAGADGGDACPRACGGPARCPGSAAGRSRAPAGRGRPAGEGAWGAAQGGVAGGVAASADRRSCFNGRGATASLHVADAEERRYSSLALGDADALPLPRQPPHRTRRSAEPWPAGAVQLPPQHPPRAGRPAEPRQARPVHLTWRSRRARHGPPPQHQGDGQRARRRPGCHCRHLGSAAAERCRHDSAAVLVGGRMAVGRIVTTHYRYKRP